MTRRRAELLLGNSERAYDGLIGLRSNDAALAVRAPWRSYQLEYHSRPSGRLCPSALSLIYR